jgi:sigma-B regulation protein RsbU (phosphoserine phosphatase)
MELEIRVEEQLPHWLEQAREIQTSLLPDGPPVYAGYEIAFRSRPAAVVGGDLFDFHETSPDILGLAIGDATGHGLPAALQARDAVVGLRMAAEQNLKLAKTMERLSRVVRTGGTGSRFISLFCAELDARGHLIYVNGGHPPPLILRAGGGDVVALGPTGPVMGLPFAPGYERGFAQLEPSDKLLLYTDGVVEAKDLAGDEFGRDLVVRSAKWAETAQDAVDLVFLALQAFTSGAVQADDETLVVVRRL